MKNIYFVRHGECELNLLKVFAGRSDSPLTILGREQARAAAKDLLDKKLIIDKIVSSTLWRANETARIIANDIGYPDTKILTSDLFVERSFGTLEGSPRSEFFDAYSYEDIDYAPRAETIAQLHDRAEQAYEFIQNLPEKNILIVSHSAFYRAFKRAVDGNPFSHEYTSPFLTIENGQIYHIKEKELVL